MREKILNAGLILSSFVGYLEWGTDQSNFLIQTEWHILSGFADDPLSIIHPFIIIPMLGQILLVITLFQKKPSRLLTYSGLGCLAVLLLFILFIGFLNMNVKMIASIMPFIIFGVLTIKQNRKKPISKEEKTG